MKICKCDFDLMVSLSMDYILSKVYINFPIFFQKEDYLRGNDVIERMMTKDEILIKLS